MDISEIFLDSVKKRFRSYQVLGEKAMAQLSEPQLHQQPEENSNSIAVIVHHISGNLISRFTDFLSADGEKPWRQRDLEFEETDWNRAQLMETWKKGWDCLFSALDALKQADLVKTIQIRSESLNVTDAIHRQLAHHAYHIGQIVYLAKWMQGKNWQNLSVPRKKNNPSVDHA